MKKIAKHLEAQAEIKEMNTLTKMDPFDEIQHIGFIIPGYFCVLSLLPSKFTIVAFHMETIKLRRMNLFSN